MGTLQTLFRKSSGTPAGKITTEAVLSRFGWTPAQLSAAKGFQFPEPSYRPNAPFDPAAGYSALYAAAHVDEWEKAFRAIAPTVGTAQLPAKRTLPAGPSFLPLTEALVWLGFSAEQHAAAQRFDFPRAHTRHLDPFAGGPLLQRIVLRHELAAWVDRVRIIVPAFAAEGPSTPTTR